MVRSHSLLLLFFSLLFSMPNLQAQWLVGGGITVGGQDEGRLGLNLKTTFPLKGRFKLSPNVTLFASEKDESQAADTKIQFTTVNLDGQLHFEILEGFYLYPLAGIQLAFSRTEVDGNSPGVGFDRDEQADSGINLGGGGRYRFWDRLSGFAEFAYTVGGIEQSGFTVGVLFHLIEE